MRLRPGLPISSAKLAPNVRWIRWGTTQSTISGTNGIITFLIFLIRARHKPLPPAPGYIQFHYKYVQTYLVHLGCPMEWLVRKIRVMGLVVGSNLPVTDIRLGFLAVLLLWFVLARNLVAVGPNLEEATLWVKYMLCIYIYMNMYT